MVMQPYTGCGKRLADSIHMLDHRYAAIGISGRDRGYLYIGSLTKAGNYRCGESCPWDGYWQILCTDCVKRLGLEW